MNAAQDCRYGAPYRWGIVQRRGSTTEHWNLPEAPHASTLRIDPAGYEQHVLPFLDRSLPD